MGQWLYRLSYLILWQTSLQQSIHKGTKRIDETTKRIDQTTKRVDETTKRIDEATKKIDDSAKNIIVRWLPRWHFGD